MAYGPYGTWVSIYDDDNHNGVGVNWSDGLPKKLYDLLNGRYGIKQKQRNTPITMLGFNDDSFVIFLQDKKYKMSVPDCSFLNDLQEYFDSNAPTFLALSFKRSAYVVDGEDEYFRKNIPFRMEQLLTSKRNARVISASLGSKPDSFFLLFSDGKAFWNEIPKRLEDTLNNFEKPIKRLMLSEYDERYLLLYNDGSYEYQFNTTQSIPTVLIRTQT